MIRVDLRHGRASVQVADVLLYYTGAGARYSIKPERLTSAECRELAAQLIRAADVLESEAQK